MKRSTLFLTTLCFLILFASQIRAQEAVRVDEIVLEGNKITKDFVVLRELPFSIGDSIPVSDLADRLRHAKENLDNLSIFNFVNVFPFIDPARPNNALIYITVEERWYIWPVVDIRLEERNLSTWLKSWDFKKITIEGGVRIDNFLGLKHKLIITGHGGYQWGAFLGYRDIALSKNGKHYIGFDTEWNSSHNIDAFTLDNEPARFNIRGITLENKWETRFNYYYRRSARESHNVNFYYELTHLADTVLQLNPHYWGTLDTKRNAFRLQYDYKRDQRDYHPYPLKGYYMKAGVNTYLASDFSVRYAQLTLNGQYFQPLAKRWFASTVLSAGFSTSNVQAYILDKAIGYGNVTLRGYEYKVADGQTYVVSNNTLKFNILPTKIFLINWLSWLPKFNKLHMAIYANVHFDMGYAHNKWESANTLSNQFLYAGGVGIDFVTYYDLAIGVDYSINKQGKGGFYFTIKVPFI